MQIEENFSSKLITWSTGIIGGMLFALGTLFFINSPSDLITYSSVYLGATIFLGVSFYSNRTGKTKIAGRIIVVTGLIMIPARMILSGGIHSPVVVWWMFLVAFALYFVSVRFALVTAVLATAEILLIGMIDSDYIANLTTYKTIPDQVKAIGLATGCLFASLFFIFIEYRRELWQKRAKSNQKALLQSEKRAAISELAGGILHEIANPLTILRGHQSIIKRTISQSDNPSAALEKISIHLDKQEHSLQKISQIINSMARTIRNQKKTSQETVEIEKLFEDLTILSSQRIGLQSIKLEMPDFSQVGSFSIKEELSQVIINLLNNAIDALSDSQQESKIVRISLSNAAEGTTIIVSDNGPGIPEEQRDQIFEAFYTTKAAGKGTGLGLSICSHLVKTNGGTLSLSIESGWTSFIISLPTEVERSALPQAA